MPEDSVEHGSTGNRTKSDDSVEHGSTSSRPEAEETGMERICHWESDDTGDTLCLRVGNVNDGFFVADNGVGIPQEERSQVFDPGYSSNGTGLGLTIVRQIAEAHDWSVSLATGSRGGARFEFRFRSGEGSA